MAIKFTNYLNLHLFELKYNIFVLFLNFLYIFSICYYYSNSLIYMLVKTLIELNLLKYLIFTSVSEVFLTNLSVSFFVTTFLFIQTLLIQVWFFFSSGLIKNENLKIIKVFLTFFSFNIIITKLILVDIVPNIWFFFIKNSFTGENLFNIFFEPKLDNYFYFILLCFISIYILFFYFIMLYFLLINNIINIKMIINLRKFIYLKFFLINMFFMPPDVLSQILFCLFYFFFLEAFIFISVYKSLLFKN